MGKLVIYTVGHSNHPAEYFLELLQAHDINCVVDVRSTAASRFNPQFNKKALSDFLETHRIRYLHFDKEFGARHTNPELLDEEGRVDFEKVQATPDFRSGVDRLKRGVEAGYNIALMCAEADPFDCHRFGMICPVLEEEGFDIKHIIKDKALKSNADLELRLYETYKDQLNQPSIFDAHISEQTRRRMAYRLRNKEIGYVVKH